MMGPLIAATRRASSRRALTKLDPGERGSSSPRALDDGGRLWTPGRAIGVQPGSWFHRTECFGPVLGVIRADDLDDALALQNATDFGLTGGLHSLDPDEIEHWLERVEVGNAYVNRHTTGAIVRRQPFGGWKHSSVGPGAKTGGPDDILRFVRFDRASTVARRGVLDRVRARAARPTPDSGPRQNVLRYRPFDGSSCAPAPTTTADELASSARPRRHRRRGRASAPTSPTPRSRPRIGSVRAPAVCAPSARLRRARARRVHAAGMTVDDTAVTATAASSCRAGYANRRSRARCTATAACIAGALTDNDRRDNTIVVLVRSAFWCARTCSTIASSSAGLAVLTCSSASASPVTVYAATTSGSPGDHLRDVGRDWCGSGSGARRTPRFRRPAPRRR